MAAQIEVYPDKGGEWRWRRKAANGRKTATSGEGYTERASAIAAARAEGGSEVLDVVNGAGEVVGHQHAPSDVRIVLLRADGSLVGELDPGPKGDPDKAQHVDLTPATEKGEAVDG